MTTRTDRIEAATVVLTGATIVDVRIRVDAAVFSTARFEFAAHGSVLALGITVATMVVTGKVDTCAVTAAG